MSYFGDRTAQQELLEQAQYIRREYKLTNEDMILVMLSVASAMVDPFDDRLKEIRKIEKEEE